MFLIYKQIFLNSYIELTLISINNNSSVIEKVLSASKKYFVKRKRRKSFKGKSLLLVGVRQGFLCQLTIENGQLTIMFSTAIYRRS